MASFVLLLVSTQWPDYAAQIQTLVVAFQPLVVALIIAWTIEGSLRLSIGPGLLPGGRKLWLGALDMVVTVVLLLVSVQWPQSYEAIKGVVLALQGIVAALIIAWTADEVIRAYANFIRSVSNK